MGPNDVSLGHQSSLLDGEGLPSKSIESHGIMYVWAGGKAQVPPLRGTGLTVSLA